MGPPGRGGCRGPAGQLRRAAHAYAGFALDSPTRYIALLGMRGQYAPAWDSRELPATTVFRFAAELIGAGLTQAQQQNVTDRAIGLIAALHGLVSLKISKPLYPWPLPRLIDQAVDHALQPRDHISTDPPPDHQPPRPPRK